MRCLGHNDTARALSHAIPSASVAKLFGAIGAVVGLGTLFFAASAGRIVAVGLCQAVMVSYPIAFVSPGVFSDTFVTLDFIAAVVCAVAFLFVSGVGPRLGR
jgi:hypothetical protein